MGEKGGARHGRATGCVQAVRRATDRAHALALGGTGIPGPDLLAAAPPEPDEELGVECWRDCGTHGAHQAQLHFELREGKKRSVRE